MVQAGLEPTAILLLPLLGTETTGIGHHTVLLILILKKGAVEKGWL